MKIQKIKSGKYEQFSLNIPNQILRAMQWEKGDEIEFLFNEKRELVLKKKK